MAYIGYGWNIGGHKSGVSGPTPGSKMNREQEFTITEITLLGKVGTVQDWDDKAQVIHRVEIRVLTKDGQTLASTNTMGNMHDVLQAAKDIQARGESIQAAAQRAAEQQNKGGKGKGGGKGTGPHDKRAGGGYDPDPNPNW